jgi:beta-glucosidase-like glycosyl hydrolase
MQAALVRQLKAQGDVPKEKIDEEVKKLLALKSKLGILPAKGSSQTGPGGKKSKSKK